MIKDIDKILNDATNEEIKVPMKVKNKIEKSLENLENNYKIFEIKKRIEKFKEKKYCGKLSAIIASAIILLTTTGVYAGVTTFYKEIIQTEGTREQNNTEDEYYEWGKDFSRDDSGIRYKIVTEYSEYFKLKNIWPSMVDMSELDFEKEFVLMLMTPSNLYISDIYSDDTTTYVEIKRNDIDNEKRNEGGFLTTRVINDLKREKINIKINPNIIKSENYKKLEEITADYSKDEAIADGCFVIYDSEVISKDEEQLDKFIENTNNNIESSIRIVYYDILNQISVCDILYKEGKYEKASYSPITTQVIFSSGNGIKKATSSNRPNFISYFLIDKEKWEKWGADNGSICTIKSF